MAPDRLKVKDLGTAFPAGTIIDSALRQPVSFSQMMQQLDDVQIIYIGETHSDANHHAVQLELIENLQSRYPTLKVGLEMFDSSYQSILDRWSAGQLEEPRFLELTHWYANWRYDFALYRPILTYVKNRRVPLVALNLPFHIPPKIAVGGLASLGPDDKRYLPEHIDLTNQAHRDYVRSVFEHHRVKGRDDFEHFYEAQCVWEDTMAEAIARHLGHDKMVVVIGKGHIIHKFGVPDRAFARTGVPFRTIYPASSGEDVSLSNADYIWVTPATPRFHHPPPAP
jgi:uncharacterized iron-regulated protein